MFLKRSLSTLPLLLGLSLFIGCPADETAGPEVKEVVNELVDEAEDVVEEAEAALTGSKLDLTYVTEEYTSAVIVHPARVLNSKFVDELVAAGLPIEEGLKKPTEELGLDPRQVEQIMVLLNSNTAAVIPQLMGPSRGAAPTFEPVEELQLEERPGTVPEKRDQGALEHSSDRLQPVAFQPGPVFPEGGPAASPIPTAIIRFTSEITDPSEFFGTLNLPPLEDTEIDGLKVKITPAPEAVLYFADPRTLIFTQPGSLKKIVETKSAESDLITELKAIDANHDLIVVADLMPFRPMLEEASQMLAFFLPPGSEALGAVPTKTKMLTITGGLHHDSLLSLSLIMDSSDDVTAVNSVLTDGLKQIREQYEMKKSQGLPPQLNLGEAEQQELIAMSDELVAGISNKADGNRLTITISKPGNFNQLASLLKPAIEEAKQAAEQAKEKNNLKMIGLAFHNYHDTFATLPGAGSDARERTGLSWRVHLLPFLDQAPLYDQFNLDEPWDSEHNKALISQMPDLFKTPEVTEAGKTVYQVVVGDNTAMPMEKGVRFRDFTDGLSNTVIVVEAGPDKAEIWTKPGGLEFNEEDPIAAFGNVGETFQALLTDGFVRDVSGMIDAKTLKALLTRNGGEIIGEF